MWFEVNVRLSEVTDLKWPHGTEWQCGNSTLAMSWPDHVQILSFTSMASRQGVVKHGYVSKIAGGCSSYDVIAPWPDLTWSIFLTKSCARFAPSGTLKPGGATRHRFFAICEKPQGGGLHPPPVRARVKSFKIPKGHTYSTRDPTTEYHTEVWKQRNSVILFYVKSQSAYNRQ